MQLSPEQVLALAPDAASAAAGKKLGNAKSWQMLGQSAEALWGECQGSALYQVRVDLRDMAARCSCPSRKFPCKHGLGLMLLAATAPAALPRGVPPEWVDEWLQKRGATEAKRETKAKPEPTAPVDPTAQAKRTGAAKEKRLAQVLRGLDGLDLWMNDLIRNGLAGLELQPATFWEKQAARMVDAQAPGIAARLRRLAGIPNASPDWPERLLRELGRLALLTHAVRRLDALDPALQEDVRQAVGWTLKEDDVVARGEAVDDDWFVLGQRTTNEDRLRVRRTWLVGRATKRSALLLQFSAAGAPFGEMLVAGSYQPASLVYWPSAYPQRALVRERRGNPRSIVGDLPGAVSVEDALHAVAKALGRQPWLDRFALVLRDVTPILDHAGWRVQDAARGALALERGDYWRLLSLSGGRPVQLVGEWNGSALQPLGVLVEGDYYLVAGEEQ